MQALSFWLKVWCVGCSYYLMSEDRVARVSSQTGNTAFLVILMRGTGESKRYSLNSQTLLSELSPRPYPPILPKSLALAGFMKCKEWITDKECELWSRGSQL